MPSNFISPSVLPQDEDGPVFSAPWEATAFAIAVNLCEKGVFSWPEWVDRYSSEIRLAEQSAVPGVKIAYYEVWLHALEKIAAQRGLLDKTTLDDRHQFMRDNPVPHDHEARRRPVCIA